jgi:hypothetical protein
MKIYVDGCSYTAGHGLDKKYSLGSLLLSMGEVTDCSYVGKSNYAIALDTYEVVNNFDLYIIGWTFNNRFEFNFNENIVESSETRDGINFENIPNGEFFEKEYRELQKRFFRYSSRFSIFSDYLIDSTAKLLQSKKIIFFSWEKRKCNTDLLYPQFTKDYRQQDMPNWVNNGHLNESGMTLLTDIIINEYELKK